MARARNIKPGLLQNELLGEADPIIVLAFACMWMIADKAGRLEDRPKKIRAQLFPYRSDLDMEPVLEWLEVNAFIKRYQSNVGPIIRIVNWEKHQRPHHKENESQLPPETPENSGVDEPCPNIEPCIALTQSNVEASKAQLEQPNPSDTGYRIPDT